MKYHNPSRPFAHACPLSPRTRSIAAMLAAASFGLAAPAVLAAPAALPIYKISKEGLTTADAQALAKAAGLAAPTLRSDGSFAFVDAAKMGVVPSKQGERSKDEHGNETVAQILDLDALKKMVAPADDAALKNASALLAKYASGYVLTPVVGHTTVDMVSRDGKPQYSGNIDTSVSYRFSLKQADGSTIPVIGPGASVRVAYAGDGSVIQLRHALRSLSVAETVSIITPDEAIRQCTALYGSKITQGTPTLAYYSPALTAKDASGRGTVQLLLPHYACNPSGIKADGLPKQGARLIPAVPAYTPSVQITVQGDGRSLVGKASVTGGTAPYTYRWASSSALVPNATLDSVNYVLGERMPKAETLTLQVTDANGIASTAAVTLEAAKGSGNGSGIAGGIGGTLYAAGIEQTVDEWACAQASADGFRSVMQSKGNTVSFDWRGYSAWEKDFKKTSLSGIDNQYVDTVDAQWYTGHGSPSSFTFKSAVSDGSIVPSDAQWGNDYDLEWMQLESCQVLQDTTGTLDFFARWAPVFNGLHLLNGFHTNAYCIGGGTGERFASYLYPETFLGLVLRPALTVQQAWASMAYDLEPSGVRFRSISPVNASGVNNLGDYVWGQGNVGPDIPAGSITGWIAISGTV